VTTESTPVKPKDLTEINPAPSNAAAPGDIVKPPTEVPYDPAPDREKVRALIALLLLGALFAVIILVVLAGILTAYSCHTKEACTPETADLKSIRAIIELVLTPLIGLVGAVTGFYFGSGSAKPGS
jgi:hypothetical protein